MRLKARAAYRAVGVALDDSAALQKDRRGRLLGQRRDTPFDVQSQLAEALQALKPLDHQPPCPCPASARPPASAPQWAGIARARAPAARSGGGAGRAAAPRAPSSKPPTELPAPRRSSPPETWPPLGPLLQPYMPHFPGLTLWAA